MPEKVLVVDDKEYIRNQLENFLSHKGYEVALAADGEEALDRARGKTEPDVILLDLNMPGLDGVEVLRELKRGQGTSHIPVIVVTAYNNRVLEALDSGADDFVSKPIRLTDLAVRVSSLLSVRHLTDYMDRVAAYVKKLQQMALQLEF